jgi:hypothetical protein
MSQPRRGPGARKPAKRPVAPTSARSTRKQVDPRRTAERERAEQPSSSHGQGTLSPTGMDQDPLG